MKKSKIFLLVFLSLILLGGYFGVKSCDYRKAKASWVEEKKELLIQAQDAEMRASQAVERATEWMALADERAEETARLEEELEEVRANTVVVVEEIQKLPPSEQVVKAQEYLGVEEEDIVLTDEGVYFSLEAFSLAVGQFAQLDLVLTREVPKLDEIIALQKEEIGGLRVANLELFSSIDGYLESIETWKKLYQGEVNLRLKAEKDLKLIRISGIGGFVAIVLVSGVYLLLR